jgi:hypothetical protein
MWTSPIHQVTDTITLSRGNKMTLSYEEMHLLIILLEKYQESEMAKILLTKLKREMRDDA